MCFDRYGRWEGGFKIGTLMRQTRDSVWILWDNEPNYEVWSQGDARYEVERNRWRISAPGRINPLEALNGVRRADAETLTLPNSHGKMGISPNRGDAETEGAAMTDQGTLSAKQVATKLGTDAKTFRRFLRSSACSIEPVGQGGRYEFGSGDIEILKGQFMNWRKPSNGTRPTTEVHTTREIKGAKKAAASPKRKKHTIDDDPLDVRLVSTIAQRQQGAAMANAIEEAMDLDDREPTDEELAEMDIEIDLNIDDLD